MERKKKRLMLRKVFAGLNENFDFIIELEDLGDTLMVLLYFKEFRDSGIRWRFDGLDLLVNQLLKFKKEVLKKIKENGLEYEERKYEVLKGYEILEEKKKTD